MTVATQIPFYQDLNVFCHLLILAPFPCTAFNTKVYVLVLCNYAKSARSLAQAIFLALPESTWPTCAVFKLSLFAQQDTSQRLCGHLQESETILIQRLHRENQVNFLEQRGTLLQLRLFLQHSHQLGFVAHHIHLCFQARMSDESQLAPHPRL